MRTYSLSFYSQDHEAEYQALNMKINLQCYKRNFIFYFVVLALSSSYSVQHDKWQVGVFGFAYVALILILYWVGRRGPRSFDFACFVFQFSQNLIAPMVFLIGNLKGPISDSQSYLAGQGVSYLVQSSNLGSRLYLKVATIIINLILEIYIKFVVKKEFSTFTIYFLVSNITMINYIYRQDRIQREAFLLKNNEKLWQSEIGKCAQISMITCISEKGKLSLDFNQCNQTSQREFEISSMDSFKIFLNSVRLIQKKFISTKVLNDMKNEQNQRKLLSLYTWITRYSDKTQSDNCEFIGLYNSSQYDVKIFTTWNDQQLIIHTMMIKSNIKIEGEYSSILQYERSLFSNFKDKISKKIKTIFVHYKQQGQKNYIMTNYRNMSVVYDALRIIYNYQLYINPQYQLSCRNFFLLPLIREINQTIRLITPKPYTINFQCYMDPNFKLDSCRKTIQHIIFNLYCIIVLAAKKSGYIKLTIHQKSTLVGSQVTFCIGTNVTSIQHITEAQNYQRNNYGNNDHLMISHKKVGLEIVVSEYLVGKIGPLRRIKLIDGQQANCMIQFTIYKDLSILNQ